MEQTVRIPSVVQLVQCIFHWSQATLHRHYGWLRETDNDQITLLAEVEHNRWNMEKLLLGFRKPTAEEEELIYGSKEMGDIFKKKRFVHPDIRPYDELKESSKAYDRCITAGIPLVVNNNT